MKDMPAQQLLMMVAGNHEIMRIGFDESSRIFEAQLVLCALQRNNYDRDITARELQISRARLNYLMSKIHQRRKPADKNQFSLPLQTEGKKPPVSASVETSADIDKKLALVAKLNSLKRKMQNGN